MFLRSDFEDKAHLTKVVGYQRMAAKQSKVGLSDMISRVSKCVKHTCNITLSTAHGKIRHVHILYKWQWQESAFLNLFTVLYSCF